MLYIKVCLTIIKTSDNTSNFILKQKFKVGGKLLKLGYLHPHPKNEVKEEEYVSYTKVSSLYLKKCDSI